MVLDCGHCGTEMIKQENNTYICENCGKSYTAVEAEQRSHALLKLYQKRRWQIILMAGCMVFLVIAAILLPGYSNDGRHSVIIFTATAICLLLFIAALLVRISFGKDRKKLYSE